MFVGIGGLLTGGYTLYLALVENSVRVRAFDNPIHYGNGALALSCLCLAGLLWGLRAKLGYLWATLLALGFAGGVVTSVLSGTRSGWVAIPVVIVLLFVVYRDRMPSTRHWLTWCILAVVALPACFAQVDVVERRMWTAGDQVHRYFEDGLNSTSVGLRLDMYKIGLVAFSKNPLIGIGPTGTEALTDELVQSGEIHPRVAKSRHLHNQYIDNMARYGVVGLVGYLVLLLVPCALFFRKTRSEVPSVRAIGLAGVLFLGLHGVVNLTQSMLERNMGVMMFVFVLVFLWAALKQEERLADRRLEPVASTAWPGEGNGRHLPGELTLWRLHVSCPVAKAARGFPRRISGRSLVTNTVCWRSSWTSCYPAGGLTTSFCLPTTRMWLPMPAPSTAPGLRSAPGPTNWLQVAPVPTSWLNMPEPRWRKAICCGPTLPPRFWRPGTTMTWLRRTWRSVKRAMIPSCPLTNCVDSSGMTPGRSITTVMLKSGPVPRPWSRSMKSTVPYSWRPWRFTGPGTTGSAPSPTSTCWTRSRVLISTGKTISWWLRRCWRPALEKPGLRHEQRQADVPGLHPPGRRVLQRLGLRARSGGTLPGCHVVGGCRRDWNGVAFTSPGGLPGGFCLYLGRIPVGAGAARVRHHWRDGQCLGTGGARGYRPASVAIVSCGLPGFPGGPCPHRLPCPRVRGGARSQSLAQGVGLSCGL